MLKKRLIFVLLWADGNFCLSRNFRLQHVGDVDWLLSTYDFGSLASSVDELVIIDVSRGERQSGRFIADVQRAIERFRLPITLGGGVTSLKAARQVFAEGGDKVLVNRLLVEDPATLAQIRSVFGAQSIVASVDVRAEAGGPTVFTHDGTRKQSLLSDFLGSGPISDVGEILLNHIDQDGTGRGIDAEMLNAIPADVEQQVIVMGGVGKPAHVVQAFSHREIDAVATANLLNFVGIGLSAVRTECIAHGIPLANWLPVSEVLAEWRSSQ